MLAPDYEGSDKLELSAIPWVSGTFHDVVTIDPSGTLVHLYERGPFRCGARLGYEPGRKEKDSRHLGGLGTIDAAPTLGAKAVFTYGGAGHLFAERGSVEIVGLAQALNRMRARLQVMLDNRARMLRSVSHDLRTPLTRLRLRTERMGEGAPRDAMLADIGQIERLVQSTLDYLRYDASSEALQRADIASVLQTVCAEFHDVGFPVVYDGPARLSGLCKPAALARAVSNLCDNGVKHGGHVVVGLYACPHGVRILVRDDGPGMPEAAFAKVHSHRGTLHFENIAPSGLAVRIEIPILAAEERMPGAAAQD